MNARFLRSSLAALILVSICSGALGQGYAGLGSNSAGFATVERGRHLDFPADFGAHPDFRIEWWYMTANLKGVNGQSYGAQWTLFRQAIDTGRERPGFNSQQIWMGHVAVTSSTEHRFSEKFARGGIGQAGVRAAPFRAWIDDWSIGSSGDTLGARLERLDVSAYGPQFSYKLKLASDLPLVLHGEQGISQKSHDGVASYYYSQPHYTVTGFLTLQGRQIAVTGQAWIDQEWTSQALSSSQTGWDWFSLHLTGGQHLMLFRLRGDVDGSYAAGTWINADGTYEALSKDDIRLTPLANSTVDGHSVPTRWRMEVPSRGVSVEASAINNGAWMATSVPYWEGPIAVSGTHSGEGYLEMTGY